MKLVIHIEWRERDLYAERNVSGNSDWEKNSLSPRKIHRSGLFLRDQSSVGESAVR